MDLRWGTRNARLALLFGLCAIAFVCYVTNDYLNLKENFTFDKIYLMTSPLEDNRKNNLEKKRYRQNSTMTRIHMKSTSPWYTITNIKTEAGVTYFKKLPSIKSDWTYPPFVNLTVLKKLSLEDLKEKSNNYKFENPPVVPIIHQSWKVKTLPLRFAMWSRTWKEKFPNFQYKLWTDEDNHNFVRIYFPWFWKRYSDLMHAVQKADAVRYLYLFAQGGIYADLDAECLKNFEHLLKNYSVIFGAMAGTWYATHHPSYLKDGYVQNSFMYSVPGHPFWLEVIETIMKRPPSNSPESTTGPFMLQEVISRWRRRFPQRWQREIRIYPPMYFNPFSWITRKYPECKDLNSMTSMDIAACKAHFPKSYVIQYHTQTWGRGARNIDRNVRRRL